MYHLFEFYIHHDSPLACRIPKTPLEGTFALTGAGSKEQDAASYVPLGPSSALPHPLSLHTPMARPPPLTPPPPLVFALSGVLRLSHLRIAPALNVLLHTPSRRPAPARAPRAGKDLASIESAIAYSRHPHETTKIVIGDPLTLDCSIRWLGAPRGVGGSVWGYWWV